MVETWRARFSQPELPFVIVQLGAGKYGTFFPPIRAAEAAAAAFPAYAGDRLPLQPPQGVAGVSMVVTYDLADATGSVHYKNKTEVGRRVALAVARSVYNSTEEASGPVFTSLSTSVVSTTADTNAGPSAFITLQFSHADGLQWRPANNCSRCCNASQMVLEVTADSWITPPKNVSAEVSSSGTALVATIPPNTTAVRYGWQMVPQCLLFNAAGLPAGPFSKHLGASLEKENLHQRR